MGTCVHGMAGPSLHVCARKGFLTISDSLVFLDSNALDVCARKGLFFIKIQCVFKQKCSFFFRASLQIMLGQRVARMCPWLFCIEEACFSKLHVLSQRLLAAMRHAHLWPRSVHNSHVWRTFRFVAVYCHFAGSYGPYL